MLQRQQCRQDMYNIQLLQYMCQTAQYTTRKSVSTIKIAIKTPMLTNIVEQHMIYKVAFVIGGCSSTQCEIVTAGSDVIWLG